MSIKFMKLIDEVFGPIFCLVFCYINLIRRIIFGNKYSLEPQRVKNILVIKFFGMGSIILAGPMLLALKTRFPAAKTIILTFLSNKEICRRIGFLDEVVAVDPSSPLRFIKSLLKSILYIRSKHCEISIDMEFFAKSTTLIQYLCASKIRVGYFLIQTGILFKMMWRGNLLTHNVYYNLHRHTTEAFLALARSIGADTENMNPVSIKVYDEDVANLKKLLSDVNIQESDHVILLNINSSSLCLERRWPIEKFVELSKKLLDHCEARIVLIGDMQDKEYVDRFFGLIGDNARLVNLAGNLDIGMLAILLKRSKLFITNDSGPLHIAASLGVPSISFFGPEIPERYGPVGDKQTVFYSGIYCSPCLNVYNQKSAICGGKNECMHKILVEDVLKVIQDRWLKDLNIQRDNATLNEKRGMSETMDMSGLR